MFTQRFFSKVFLPALALSSILMPLGAQAWWWNHPNRGIVIEATTPQGIQQNAGASAHITGRLKYIVSKTGAELSIPNGIRNNLEIHAFFPDMTHEVTDQVALTSDFHYSYDTPALSDQNLNTFILVVGKITAQTRHLLAVQSKLVMRLEKRALKLAQLQANPRTKPERIAEFIANTARIQGVLDRVLERLGTSIETLARYDLPLQVGSVPAQAGYSSTVLSGFRFEIEQKPSGSTFVGQSAFLKGTITNLTHKTGDDLDNSDDDADDVGRRWVAKFGWNGSNVKTFAPQALSPDQSISFTYTTPALTVGFPKFTAEMYRTGPKHKREHLKGVLSMPLPVAAGGAAPVIVMTSPSPDAQYLQQAQVVTGKISVATGTVDRATISVLLNGTTTGGLSVNRDVTSLLTITSADNGKSYDLFGSINPLDEGAYTLAINASDVNQNEAAPFSASFRIDRSVPVISLSLTDGILTRLPNLQIENISVSDLSPTLATVILNGNQILQTGDPAFSLSLVLQEGLNILEIYAQDSAQNNATPVRFYNLVLDTISPTATLSSPHDGQVVGSLNVPINGVSSESLLYIKANNVDLAIAADHKTFSGAAVAAVVGNFPIHLEMSDLAGNTSSQDLSVQISLNVLNANLVSVAPDPDGAHLFIVGAPGAAKPGVPVSASASFFNYGNTTAAADGSFSIRLFNFIHASVSATDAATGRTESTTVTFGAGSNTALSGVVKDTNGNPLAGVTVGIGAGAVRSVTDATGTFMFSTPPTGDQILQFDGTTVTQAPLPAPQRQFSKTNVVVNVGIAQNNVLQRPIYLNAIPLDGTATTVSTGSGGIVTSSLAPGVEFNIPAGKMSFPDGSPSGLVSIQTISAQFATIAPMEFAQPNNLVALEPSGAQFSSPVELTLPNDNELPAGTDVVIWSMSSSKGIWEIGGAATVSSDGQSIITKPNMGIMHFSLVYAAPIGPTIRSIGGQQNPAVADTFNGALSTSVTLPSYKSLEQDSAPSLVYKSNWARPSVLLTNSIDVPRNDITVSSASVRREDVSGSSYYDAFYYVVLTSETGHGWIEPDFIDAQFFTANITGDKVRFTGLPNQAIVSYALDLINPATGQFLDTGLYPYFSHYETHLKNMVVATRKVTVQAPPWSGASRVSQDSWAETRQIEKVYPQDLRDFIQVENQSKSSAGTGWRIAGYQRIVNPNDDQIIIEEATGGLSTYSINSLISTVATRIPAVNPGGTGVFTSGEGNFSGADLNSWPNAYVPSTAYTADTDLNRALDTFKVNLLNDSHSRVNQYLAGGAMLVGYDTADGFCTSITGWAEKFVPSVGQILALPDGRVFITDQNDSIVYLLNSGNLSVFAGSFLPAPTFSEDPAYASKLSSFAVSHRPDMQNNFIYRQENEFVGTCPVISSSGLVTNPGFNGDGGLSSSLNHPMGIAAGPTPNTIVIADTGNNRVRVIDLNGNTISTVAGNGQNFDNGDGGPATQASIFHPRGVAYDSIGNLYISTEKGFIRRVDPTGVISTFAGLPLQSGGSLIDKSPASQIALNRPFGMVVDNQNGILYVADTGNHRILKIDFQTSTAVTVAGVTGVSGSTTGQSNDVPATTYKLSSPTVVGLDDNNNLLIGDTFAIRRVLFQHSADGSLAYSPNIPDHSTLKKNADGTWIRGFRSGGKIFYDTAGRESYTLDRIGRTNSFAYDAQGRLTSVTDPVGRAIQYSYSGAYLSSIVDPAGRVTTFSYSGNFLVGVRFPDGTQRAYGYNPQGLLTSETNERGLATNYSYNQWNRLAAVTKADGATVAINDSGSATAANNYTGGSTGTLQTYGSSPGQVFDGITDARSIQTTFIRDTNGYITTVIDGAGNATTVMRNASGQPTLISRPDGTGISLIYDPNTNDLISQTDSGTGITTSQTYDAYGNLLTVTNGRGYKNINTIDPNTGFVLASSDPLGHGMTYIYNAFGLPASIIDALGKTTTLAYDNFGNSISRTDPKGISSSVSLDLAGNIIATTDAKGQLSHLTYDAFNRVTSVTTPKNETTVYSYLPTGQLAQIVDPLGNTTTYEYDLLGRLVKKKDALGFTSTLQYDANGNITQEIDPNGNVKIYSYDTVNRLIQKTLPDNVITLAYDARSNLTETANQQSVAKFSYDVASRLISAQSYGVGAYSNLPAVSLTYAYDFAGNRISMTDPTGTSTYVFDPANRLTAMTNPLGELVELGYSSANQLSNLSRPGSQMVLSFDTAGFVSSIVHTNSAGQSLASFQYQVDGNGARTAITNKVGTRALAYDANSQLVSATNPESGIVANNAAVAAATENFSYDAVANRTSDQGGGYTFDSRKQRLTEDYRNFYFWDNNGNLISKQQKGMNGPTSNFHYSSENQLLGFKMYDPAFNATAPALEVTYVYDALGRRISKQVVDHRASNDPKKSFSRSYVYNGSEILLEYSGSGNLLARYTHSGLSADSQISVNVTSSGVAAAIAQSAGSYQFIKDGQGTIVDIADNAGNLIQHYIYSAFGALIGIQDANAADVSENAPLRTAFTYTGREFDSESGYYYFRARYYDPNSGRFLQKDPHPGILRMPSTVVNSYVYGGNNPANILDPNGASFWQDFGVTILTMVVVAVSIVLTQGASSPFIPIIVGAISGAVIGASSAAIYGGNVGQGAATGAVMGAITGAAAVAGGGIGGAVKGVGGVALGAAAGAAIGAVGFGVAGYDPRQGAIAGFIAGGFAALSAQSRQTQVARSETGRTASNPYGCRGRSSQIYGSPEYQQGTLPPYDNLDPLIQGSSTSQVYSLEGPYAAFTYALNPNSFYWYCFIAKNEARPMPDQKSNDSILICRDPDPVIGPKRDHLLILKKAG